jgi:hypothetical protein
MSGRKNIFLLAKLNDVDASYFNTLELCTVNLQCTPALGDHVHDDPFVEHLCQAYLDRESHQLGLLRRLQQRSVTYTITTSLPSDAIVWLWIELDLIGMGREKIERCSRGKLCLTRCLTRWTRRTAHTAMSWLPAVARSTLPPPGRRCLIGRGSGGTKERVVVGAEAPTSDLCPLTMKLPQSKKWRPGGLGDEGERAATLGL